MHSSRTIVRVPQVCRVHRVTPSVRSLSYLPTPFFTRFGANGFGFPSQASHDFGFPAISHDFAPLMRLIDDMINPSQLPHSSHLQPRQAPRPVIYQPRFDVREAENGYELRGEVPGIEQQDLTVEFSDAQTLVIRGRTSRDSSNVPASAQEGEAQPAQEQQQSQSVNSTDAEEVAAAAPSVSDNSDAMSTHSTSSYQKPTVEDATEDGADEVTPSPSTPGAATPASSVADANEAATANASATSEVAAAPAPAPKQQHAPQPTSPHYWVSERSVGEFQRTFTFPTRVDHDGVRASLKNGVLSISVPRASKPVSRRIQVQ